MRITDPTGNVWEGVPSSVTAGERIRVGGLPPILAEESAYRVRLELARQVQYPRADLLTLRGLQVPPPGRIYPVRKRVALHGLTLEITHLLGARTSGDSSLPTAVVRISGPADRFRIRKLPESRNRNPLFEDSVFQYGEGSSYIDLGPVPRDRPLTLRLAITPRRTVEFLAHAAAADEGGGKP